MTTNTSNTTKNKLKKMEKYLLVGLNNYSHKFYKPYHPNAISQLRKAIIKSNFFDDLNQNINMAQNYFSQLISNHFIKLYHQYSLSSILFIGTM